MKGNGKMVVWCWMMRNENRTARYKLVREKGGEGYNSKEAALCGGGRGEGR